MSKYLFARIFIESPDTTEAGYKFVELLSTYLYDLCKVNTISVTRYKKIVEYVKIEIDLFPKIQNSTESSFLSHFILIIEKLGNGWELMGSDKHPEAIYNSDEDNYLFDKKIKWANILTVES